MADAAKSTRGYWVLFLISLVFIIVLLTFIPEWFWIALPFVGTFLVKALDKI